MIVVVGRVVTDPAKRDQLIEVAQKVAAASREEAGCIDYRLFEDTEQPNRFVFVEEWQDEEALQRRFPHAPHRGVHGGDPGDAHRPAGRQVPRDRQHPRPVTGWSQLRRPYNRPASPPMPDFDS